MSNPPTERLAYSVTEAARVVGVSERFIRECIRSTDPRRSLRAKRLSETANGQLRIQASELRRWLDDLPDA